jgi:uncharacterized protein (TIGR01619 family)
MGLFDRLYRKKQNKPAAGNAPETITRYMDEWEFYFSNVDDVLGSIYLNLGLRGISPVADKPFVVWLSIKMNNPRQDGLSSGEEFEQLTEIEDFIVPEFTKKHNAIYPGRLTSSGRRDIYFYAGDILLYDKTISTSMARFPNYDFDYGTKEDAGWVGYLDFLYPNPSQMQSIQNRRVVDNLEKHGDSLTKERAVDHWIFFKTNYDRTAFINKIKNESFLIKRDKEKLSSGKYPYKLQISRKDKVDHKSVDEYVLHLWRLAQEFNGEYDGWETSVEKD